MKNVVLISKESGIPLLGLIQAGVIDRGSNLLQVRPTTICNLECIYCSTDSGPVSSKHKVDYVAEVRYLIETVEEVARFKGEGLLINIDSVGEPTTYPNLIELINGIKKIPEVKEVSMQTNGTLLTKEKIMELEKAGLDKINLSVNAIDQELAKTISCSESYSINKIMENARFIAEKTKISLWLCPVWIPKVNDKELPKIISFAKEINAKLGIQKYEVYKYSRKPNGVKGINYWKFYQQLKGWEKEFGVKLKFTNKELGFEKRQRAPTVFEKNERAHAVIKCEGWLEGQMVGVAKERSITINNCKAKVGDKVKIKIVQNNNGIYIADAT